MIQTTKSNPDKYGKNSYNAVDVLNVFLIRWHPKPNKQTKSRTKKSNPRRKKKRHNERDWLAITNRRCGIRDPPWEEEDRSEDGEREKQDDENPLAFENHLYQRTDLSRVSSFLTLSTAKKIAFLGIFLFLFFLLLLFGLLGPRRLKKIPTFSDRSLCCHLVIGSLLSFSWEVERLLSLGAENEIFQMSLEFEMLMF